MPCAYAASRCRLMAMSLILLIGSGIGWTPIAAAGGAGVTGVSPAAPTLSEAHQYFATLVAEGDVKALYETKGRNGEVLGYESFPVQAYRSVACDSGLVLKNGVRIDIDWTVVDKSQASDGTVTLLQGHNVLFPSLHMVSLEGGVVVLPANSIQRLILAISDELSRNRLSKAIELIASACRAKSKFD